MSIETALAFINKVLLKLQKDSTKKHAKLRDTIKIALEHNKDPALHGEESVVLTLPQWDKQLNSLVSALKAAIETKSHKFATKALDCIFRLIANGLVPGGIVDEENPPRLLLEKIVECIRLCADTSDDATLTQIVKVIQAILSSSICGLHGAAMVAAFRVVYRIHVTSKAQTQLHSLSRGTLNNVLNSPFKVLRTTQSVTKYNKSSLDSAAIVPPNVEELEISASEIELSMDEVATTPPTPTISPIATHNNGTNENNNNNTEDAQNDNATSDIASVPSGEKEESSTELNKEAQKTPPNAQPLENITVAPTPRDISSKPLTMSGEGMLVGDELMALNDCLLIFNHLCKLSANSFDAELEITSESQDTRNKNLALELILSVLESSGPSFRNYERFIHEGLREHLSVALMVNGNSANPKIYKLVLSIFLHVLSYFRDYMKDEIEDFVTKNLLRSLETAGLMQQRWMSLQVILQICKNPQLLLDIFINYDCDLEMKDIFERIVNDLSKVSQGNFQTDHKTSPMQDAQVKLLALEALVVLLQSMVEWSHPLYEESQKMSLQSANGEDPNDFIAEQVPSPASPATMKELTQQADQFSKQKQFKLCIDKGKPKFAISAKKGMQYFFQIGVIKQQPEEVAVFFKNTAGLDKAKIGEYIGEKDEFNLQVMQCYVNLFDFAKCEIDIALRQFLSGFRLPGEAQKIDRIIEKFAERYYRTNSGSVIASAESAYILAFATVMLATDLHSTQIKKRMTKEEWLKMNKGNNAKQNFDENYLLGIYDRIAAERLKVTYAEGEQEDTRDFAHRVSQEVKAYHSARNINHVKSMFATAWHAVLAAFSVLLDQTDDPKVVGLVLSGFKHAVRVSGIFSMDLERSAFITSLSKFTVLDGLRDMKQKHIDSIQAIIAIAQADGNYISDSWTQVQRCISFLDKIHVYGVIPIEDTIVTPRMSERSERDRQSRFMKPKNEGITLDLVVHQIDSNSIDKLYAKSNLLSSGAVIALVKSLCEVSIEEITAPIPSLFSLQKLADVVFLNLYRVRPVWVKIWSTVADHFVKAGTVDNLKTSMFAIETLRGIVVKVLEQEDLSSYSFQKELMRPFEQIFFINPTKDVQELIIQSFSQIIMARGNNINSGWKNVFSVFSIAAGEEGQIMCLAFELIEEVSREYFHCIADVFFVDCVNSFSAFANNKTNRDVSLRAIESLSFCAVQLANGRVCPVARDGADANTAVFTDCEQHLGLWFPLLTGLSRVIGHQFDDLRANALETLFRVLSLFGSMFSAKLWELVFRGVLLPIFDNIGYSKGRTEFANSENPWLTATCMSAFKAMVELFTNFIDSINFLLADMLDLFVSCILQDNEYLSRISCSSMVSMLTANGPKFTNDMWALICENFGKAFDANTPYEIADLALKRDLPTPPPTRPEPARTPFHLRNSDSTGFNSLPTRLGLSSDRPSTASSVTSSTITSSLNSSVASGSSNPSSPHPDASPPPSIRRRASVAGGGFNASLSSSDLGKLETIPDTPPPYNASSPNLATSSPTTSSTASPVHPASSTPPTSSPKLKHDMVGKHSKLIVPPARTSHDDLPTPDTRRRSASVAGPPQIVPPSISAAVQHSTSVPEIQKLELNQHLTGSNSGTSSPVGEGMGRDRSTISFLKMGSGTNSPPVVFNHKPPDATSRLRSRCIVQLLLIHAIDDIALSQYAYLLTSHLVSLIECLEVAYQFSHKTNKEPAYQDYMTRTGAVDLFRKQEINSISSYFTICFKLYGERTVDAEQRIATAESRIIPRIRSILTEFVEELDVASKIPIIKQILKSILQLEEGQFLTNTGIFYQLFTNLMLTDNRDIRVLLRDIMQRLGKVKQLATA